MKLSGAIIGLGRMGRIHLQNLVNHPTVLLKAACSDNDADASWLAKEHPEMGHFLRLDEMLVSEELALDFIFIVTPSGLHPRQIEACLQHDLHVFCEKPLAVDEAGCRFLEEVREKFVRPKLMVGFMRRFDSSYQRMQAVLAAGEIGNPILFRAYSADADRFIANYLPYAAHGSGHFLDMSIHDIDLLHWMVPGLPQKMMACGGTFKYTELEPHGGDNAAALLQLDNGCMAFFYTGRTAAHGYQIETEIIGTRGSIRLGGGPDGDFVEVFSKDGRTQKYAQDFEERFADAFKAEVDYFLHAIVADAEIEPSWSAGLLATRTAIALQQAFESNNPAIN